MMQNLNANWKWAVKAKWWDQTILTGQFLPRAKKEKINSFETIRGARGCGHMRAAPPPCWRRSRRDSTWVLFHSDSRCLYHRTHMGTPAGRRINTGRTRLNWSSTTNRLPFLRPFSSLQPSPPAFCSAQRDATSCALPHLVTKEQH